MLRCEIKKLPWSDLEPGTGNLDQGKVFCSKHPYDFVATQSRHLNIYGLLPFGGGGKSRNVAP
jgi:hypothetical protein